MITIETIESLNYLLAVGGLVTILATLILIFDFRTKRTLQIFVQTWGLLVAFIGVLGSTILSLIYSEVFGFIPCGLCWLERIALYPQVLLLGVGLYFKDKLMPRYGIALSVFGLIVSLYHHYIQMGGSQFIKCPATGAGADCAKRFFFEFDFMTFPLAVAIFFVFLIALYVYILKTRTN